MPVPRAARLAARKSVIPDPSLYGDPSDDSDDDHATAPPARSTTIKTTTASSSKGKARASTAPRTSSVVVNGTRKQPRSSTESFDEPQEASKPPKQGSRPLDDPRRLDARDDRSTVNEPATKRKRIDKRGEDEPSGHRDDHIQTNRPTASATSAEAKNTTKRTKASQRPAEDEDPEDTARHSQSSSQRKGHFVPRAATSQSSRPNKPPPEFSAVLDGSDDDSAPFLFTTNPPTPHAPGSAKRPASKPKQNPKGKAPRIHSRKRGEQDDEPDNQAVEEPRQPPIASTSRVQLTPPPRSQPDGTRVAITTHETPVQIRNVAFRQGAGTPGTANKSARRNSNGSARRGSSIGGGFTATPHPDIANAELWRSTDPLLPIASRTRTILSWATQRDRTRLFEGKRLSEAEQIAKSAIDDFVDGICDLSIDTSIPNRQVQKPDPAQLPPHPQNVANAAKKIELQAEFGAIAEEQNSRQTTTAIYSQFSAQRTANREGLSTAALTQRLDAVSIAETFDLSRPGPKSLAEALEMGRTLLQEADARRLEDVLAKKKDRKKSKVEATDGEKVLDSQIRETLEDTAHLRHLTHRLSGFTRVASKFIDHRSAETHRALASHSLQGIESSTASASSTTNAQGSMSVASGAGLSGLVGVVGAPSKTGGGLDPLDLLRAISRTDTSRR
ncbi:hypothetical protein JCM3766R1_006264 [Sporobolomyces carnicolor]